MNFAKNSFIVNNKLQLAIVDKRIPKNMETNLNNMGVSIIKSTCCSNTILTRKLGIVADKNKILCK